MRRFLILLFSIGFFSSAFSQESGLKNYWVEFRDKANNPYLIYFPEAFLSQRAIARRQRQGIAIDPSDLPVSPAYLDSLKQLGVGIHNTSKWLNGASVLATDSIVALIDSLYFVKSVLPVGKHFERQLLSRKSEKKRDSISNISLLASPYGLAENQLKMLRGDYLHSRGFKGKGLLVAILDGGFSNVEIMPFFDSLRATNRLLYTKDFVDKDDFVFESSGHGSEVLSVMGANYPGRMVGTAPDATYICLKTEDVRGEYLVEECNWVAGLEYADSLGVDIVNSSLGYTTFNDQSTNHSYATLDGKSALATRGASMASSKGMLLVNSAGNEGNTKWKFIDVPSDAENILAVGGVTASGQRARFSSLGPTADGRIKPDVVASSTNVAVASIYSAKVVHSRGTSFSAPIIAGLAACLWQAFPEKTNLEIMAAIRQSSSQAGNPDNELGYGLPDFAKAFQLLNGKAEGKP